MQEEEKLLLFTSINQSQHTPPPPLHKHQSIPAHLQHVWVGPAAGVGQVGLHQGRDGVQVGQDAAKHWPDVRRGSVEVEGAPVVLRSRTPHGHVGAGQHNGGKVQGGATRGAKVCVRGKEGWALRGLGEAPGGGWFLMHAPLVDTRQCLHPPTREAHCSYRRAGVVKKEGERGVRGVSHPL